MLHFFGTGYHLSENSYTTYEMSNMEITKWAEYYLGKHTSFHQSGWLAGKVTDHPNDILLGNLTWDSRDPQKKLLLGKVLRNWVKDNALNASRKCHPNTYILTPWVVDFPEIWQENMPYLEEQLLAANKIFALCGEIWINRTLEKFDNSIQARVKNKLVHCNMGVEARNLSTIKTKFNPIGERQLLHISNLGDYKRFEITCQTLENIETILHVASPRIHRPIGLCQADWLGLDYVFNFIGNVDNDDDDFNNWVVETCDFYIHTADMDAQATTILENCTRGLIPLITPESGFASPHAIYLTHDPSENQKIVEWALNLPESDLLNRSRLLREQVIKEHNWEGIFNKIWNEIISDIAYRNVNAIV